MSPNESLVNRVANARAFIGRLASYTPSGLRANPKEASACEILVEEEMCGSEHSVMMRILTRVVHMGCRMSNLGIPFLQLTSFLGPASLVSALLLSLYHVL